MAEKVIALINRKGGVGKTTSAGYIAMCLQKAGKTVTGLDADPDQSFLKWHSTDALPFPVLAIDKKAVEQQINDLDGYVIIDTPPNDPEIIYDISDVIDEIIVPLSATGFDVNRLATTLKAVARVEKLRGKPLSSVLLIRWSKNQNISHEVQTILSAEGIPLLDNKIRDLTRYKSFDTPTYLEEYEAVLKELEII